MNSKERVIKALNHQEVKVPIDIGGTVVTGMHATVVAGLRDYYGLEKRPVKIFDVGQMLGMIEDDLRNAMRVDTMGIYPRYNIFGNTLDEGWKPWRYKGLEVLVPRGFNTTTDEEGNVYAYPCGDLSCPPSGKLPKDGYYFDAIIRQEPINEEMLDPQDNLEEFGPLSDEDLNYFERQITQAASTEKAIIAHFGGTQLADIALVPGLNLKHPKGIRDIEEWYISVITRQDYIHQVFSKQTKIALENLSLLNKKIRKIGNLVDAVFVCGTDFGSQESLLFSEEIFRELWLPYYKQINQWIHQNTSWKTFKHSCGAIEPLMDDFIEAGFDIINPVQTSAAGMDPKFLKSKYGDKIVFWGGGVDTQRTLPFGTPEEVRNEVLERCEIFSKQGGFVFAPIHNIQANTPIANIIAMLDAVHEYNGEK